MVNQPLLDYIRQQLGAQVSKEQIQQQLVAQGWSIVDLNEAFAMIGGTPLTPPSPQSAAPLEEKHTAGVGARFLNFFLDAIFSFGFSWVAGFCYGVITALLHGATSFWAEYLLGTIVSIFYYVLFESVWQRTPAKWITGTKVVCLDGTKPGPGRILGRTLCRYIPFDPLSFLIGKYTYGWHDRISKTMVVPAEYTMADAATINPRNRGKSHLGIIILVLFLVLIPVIGILSGIVLAALDSARAKSAEAKVTVDMQNILIQGAIYQGENNSYQGFCASPGIVSLLIDASQSSTKTSSAYICNDALDHWAATVPLKAGGYTCVDDFVTKAATITSALGTSTSCGSN